MEFSIAPAPSEVMAIGRLIVSYTDNGAMGTGQYGSGTALSNGIELEVQRDGVEHNLLTNSHPVQANMDWARYCYDTSPLSFGSGDNMIVVRWTFSKS